MAREPAGLAEIAVQRVWERLWPDCDGEDCCCRYCIDAETWGLLAADLDQAYFSTLGAIETALMREHILDVK